MEVKEILQKIRPREKPPEIFLALLLDEGLVKSAAWQVAEGVVKILTLGESRVWEKEEEIIEAVDASLSLAIEKLSFPQSSPEPSKIIFGLPPAWIKDNKIAVEKLEVLKKISRQLELSPVGFVVATEALVYHLKTTEGVPPTAILAGLTSKELKVTLVKLGRIVGNQTVNRSDSLGADLAEGLSRFGSQEVFPARIFLYNSSEKLSEAKQELTDYSWPEQGINFLHLPRVEILPEDDDIKAIALAGGREVTQIEGIGIGSQIKQNEKEEVVEEEMAGFLKERDITEEMIVVPPEKPKPVVLPESRPSEVPRMSFLRLPSLPSKSRTNFLKGVIMAGLIIFGGVLGAAWWYLPSAEIILTVKSQPLEKNLTVNVDPLSAVVDNQSQTLPGRPLKEVITGDKMAPVTGTKIVGERASGKVIIYNRTAKSKIFNTGTQILGPGGLKFVLNGEVTVASESAGPDYTSLPGKAEVKIEAVDIGTESNLASGTEFAFAVLSRSDFVARNEEALSGGTSREIAVVAKKDQEDLLFKLGEELKNKAAEKLSGKALSGLKIIPESLTVTVLEKKFDQEINQEATELRLDLKSEFAALTYDPQELNNLIKEKIKEFIPAGFEYRDQEEEANFNLKSITKSGVAIFDLKVSAKLISQLDLAKTKNDLLGKRPDAARQYLVGWPNVKGSEIKFRPSWLGPLTTLPHILKNIKIEVRAE